MDWEEFRDMTLDAMVDMYVEELGLSDVQAEEVVYMSEFEPGFWRIPEHSFKEGDNFEFTEEAARTAAEYMVEVIGRRGSEVVEEDALPEGVGFDDLKC